MIGQGVLDNECSVNIWLQNHGHRRVLRHRVRSLGVPDQLAPTADGVGWSLFSGLLLGPRRGNLRQRRKRRGRGYNFSTRSLGGKVCYYYCATNANAEFGEGAPARCIPEDKMPVFSSHSRTFRTCLLSSCICIPSQR